MATEVGSRLGPYEIVAPLGAGGMGEVYRARDPRIGREVAVKILPRIFAEDSDRLRRFQQEARAAGMLNHPNLLTIFDLGTHDGVPFIVSELLEGETLRQRLTGGALPVKRVIEFALQMAAGLAAAHEKGIIHRDLKPENIFITSFEERVKLLDFGLAKVLTESESSLTAHPTQRQTSPGIVMGTASYMSPEQVRGQSLDHRTDIFSFGTVLYEMLTGRQAFHRDSQVEAMNAILTEDPPLSLSNPALERVVLHALEKNPQQRFQSVRDVAFALETFSGTGESQPVSGPARARRADKRTEKKPFSYQAVTFRRGFVMTARFARDGSVVYGAAWEDRTMELFSSFPGDPQSRPLGIPEADVLAVSPTTGDLAISLGRHFTGGWVTQGTLARIPQSGGVPREIAEEIQDADWLPDGKNLAVIRRAGEGFVIEYPLGHRIYETSHWISHLRISPKGDRIAFLDHPLWGDDGGSVAVIDLQGERQLITRQWRSLGGVAWTPKGDEVCVAGHGEGAGRDLHAINLSGKERVILAMPGRIAIHDIHKNGDLLVSADVGRREILVGKRGTPAERNLSWFDWSFLTDVSADGSRILFEEQGNAAMGAIGAIYLRKVDGSPAVHLGEGRVRAISADGKWVVAMPRPDGDLEMLPTGVGESRVISCRGLESIVWWYFFPDGKRLLIWGNEPGRGNQMFEVPLDQSAPRRAIGPEGTHWPMAIAPDGSAVAATGMDQRLMIYPVGEGEAREAPGSRHGDQALRWGRDGSLYVYQLGRVRTAIERIDLSTGERQEWQELKPSDPAGVMNIQPVLLSQDEQTYVYGYRRFLSELHVIRGLL